MAGHNKQTSFNPYPQEMLPEGFNYPKSYLELSKDTSTINWGSPADTIYPSLCQAKLLAEFHLALMGGVGARLGSSTYIDANVATGTLICENKTSEYCFQQ